MQVKEINLENGMPTCDEALCELKSSLNSGKGGAIRLKARQWLNAQLKNGKVKTVINGEDFNIFNFKALELKNKYKDL